MRKYIYIVLFLLLCTGNATAQFTLVSGTITDVNAVPYACGTISASIVNNNGQSLYLNGVQFSPSPSATKLGCPTDPTTSRTAGAYVVQLADNAQLKCGSGASIVTCAIQTQWLFTVNTQGSPPPLGTGPQVCTTTATITGTSQTLSLSACPKLSLTGGGATGPGINMTSFGVVADVRTCQGVNGVLTIGSPIFTCTGAGFCNGGSVACTSGQTPDVGKRFNATSGCCNLSIPVNNNTQVVPNNTTILSVQSPTSITLSQNATATVNAVTDLFAFWGTDDDASVSAADTAYVNATTCNALIWPPTPFLVKNPHFNTPNPNCEQLEHSVSLGNRVAYGSYVGWGSSNSVMYLDSSFPVTPCTGNAGNVFGATGCFFSYAGVHLAHLGISGGWNQVPNGGGHNYLLVNGAIGSDFIDVRLVGFSAGDGTTTGLFVSGASNLLDVYLTGFGFDGANITSGSSPITIRGGEFSNVGGVCAKMNGSTYPIVTHQVSFGTCGGVIVQLNSAIWDSFGDLMYGNTGNGTCIFMPGGNIVNLYGFQITSGGCGTNGVLLSATGPNILSYQNSVLTGGVAAINLSNSAGLVRDLGGNTIASGSITTIAPTCPTVTGATATCASVAGSTNEKGTLRITVTAAGTASGTLTMNFAGTFIGQTSTTPSCNFNPADTGTGTWNPRATSILSTRSNTAPVINWDNNAVALGNLTWDVDYTCVAK